MLTIALGLAAGLLVGVLVSLVLAVGWAIALGVVTFVATCILINLWIKKRMESLFLTVQQQVEAGQDQLRRKINVMQTKMVGGGKGLQRRLEKEQAVGIRGALDSLDAIRPLHKWNFLAERQANTLRAQLHYQIKEFDEADKAFEKCLIMDPLTLAMSMARMHKKGQMDALEKAFRKGVKRHKDEKGTMLYALYSWILVKENRIDDAIAVLNDGKDKTEDETLRTNWEHLVNGRVRRFSNAPLGDEWYALHLEQPKPIKMRHRAGASKRLR